MKYDHESLERRFAKVWADAEAKVRECNNNSSKVVSMITKPPKNSSGQEAVELYQSMVRVKISKILKQYRVFRNRLILRKRSSARKVSP